MQISNWHLNSLIFLFYSCRKCTPGIRKYFFFTSGPQKVLNIPIYVDLLALGTSETCPVKRYDFGIYILYGIVRKKPFFCRPKPPVRIYNTRTWRIDDRKIPVKAHTSCVLCMFLFSWLAARLSVCLPIQPICLFFFFLLLTSHY